MIFLFILSSCVPQNVRNSRQIASSNDSREQSNTNEISDPSFSNSNNFFELKNVATSTDIQITSQFDDSFNLRGASVHSYLKANPSTIFCGIFHFSSLTTNQNLVVAGFSRSKIDFVNNTKENFIYWNFSTAQKDQNTAFCNTPAMNSKVTSLGGGAIVYDLDELCTNCFNQTHITSSFTAVSNTAVDIASVNSPSLALRVTFITENSTNAGLCNTDSQCTNIGLDCCLNGQCVGDGTLKSTADVTDPLYLEALLDVSSNVLNKKKYPNFYNICGTNVPEDPTNTSGDLTPEEISFLDLQNLKYLYDCTTPLDGEVGICTITYKNALAIDGPFASGNDDRDFSLIYTGNKPYVDALSEVIYQQRQLYKDGVQLEVPDAISTLGTTNDNLNDFTKVSLNIPINPNIKFKDLTIRYKIDASCVPVNSKLAKCSKRYIQGQDIGTATDHFPSSNNFRLPEYLSAERSIEVSVDGALQRRGSQWDLSTTSPAFIYFTGVGLAVQSSQKVLITYFVDTTIYPILKSKNEALQKIGVICECPTNNCWLEAVKDTGGSIVNYQCRYPAPPLPEPPLQQEVLVSAKSTPHRHFASNGVYKSDVTLAKIIEDPTLIQEGAAFEYTKADLLKPNNLNVKVGFNEIYGSYTYGIGSALPAKEVRVKKGVTYDITAKNGIFGSCFFCGSDYYNNLVDLFPDSLGFSAGGYKPDLETSTKFITSKYRADDILFARSCSIPVTMIPWSHGKNGTRQFQRLNRLETQHFLYANGYNKDWYGFDYGSLIGSFDGVRWFSVGTKRRIQAKSNKLFLAINASFGDLTLENTFEVLIQDSILNATTNYPTTDYDSDGAQCQQVHACIKDSDCASTLGWDYVCENVTSIKSSYPKFDENAEEIPLDEEIFERLVSLNGNFSGPSRRCVYRGKGAPCTIDYSNVNANNSYNKTATSRTHGCSSNNYCQAIEIGGATAADKFNNRINRYGKSIILRNTDPTLNESNQRFGLHAPLIGRPYNYIGTEVATSIVRSNFTSTKVQGICLPGKENIPSDTYAQLMGQTPSLINTKSDLVNGQGISLDIKNSSDAAYYSQCPVFNEDGEYLAFEEPDIALNSDRARIYSSAQNLSTQILDVFDDILSTKISRPMTDFENVSPALYKNSCLRAPGATCFVDEDCGPSRSIANAVKSLSYTDIKPEKLINEYEFLFWQEELVCSQPSAIGTADFDLRKNRCCRETSKIITIPTVVFKSSATTPLAVPAFFITTDISENEYDSVNNPSGKKGIIDLQKAVGSDISIDKDLLLPNNPGYSRNATTYFQSNQSTINPSDSNLPILQVAQNALCASTDGCFSSEINQLLKQYETITKIAKNTCCSENWIRNFAKGNGNNHEWTYSKMQQPPINTLECLNYVSGGSDDTDNGVEVDKNCFDPADTRLCDARAIPEPDAIKIANWMAKFNLTGVPSIVIEDPITNTDFQCTDGDLGVTPALPIPNMTMNAAPNTATLSGEYEDATKLGLKASNMDNFNRKQVFSQDEFSCCQPAGTQVVDIDKPEMCCTGFVNKTTRRCALRDYTNISLYLNRYISSEAQDLPSSSFDTKTGFIKNESTVIQLACQKRLCASGYLATGGAYANFRYPKQDPASNLVIKRFIENDTDDDVNGLAAFYEAGLKWHTNLYCIPQAVAEGGISAVVGVFNCN